ncbi:MAG: hypothetical protein IVW53_16235 [Chloroflexi bacterium]|nr:hypothetical protein [Chloroflexota bacterium]
MGQRRRSREEKKAEPMAQAEAAIEELIGWSADTTQPTLAQIEGVVLKLQEQLSEQMAQTVLAEEEVAREKVPGPSFMPYMWKGDALQGRQGSPFGKQDRHAQSTTQLLPLLLLPQGAFPPG